MATNDSTNRVHSLPKMYYIVSNRLAQALSEGRNYNGKGAFYGCFATYGRAADSQKERGLSLCSKIIEM